MGKIIDMFESIDRKNSSSVKLEEAKTKFGTDDLLPLWVADMDIQSPKYIQEAIKKRASHPIYGYTIYSDEYYQSIIKWYKNKIEKEFIVPSVGVVPSMVNSILAFSQKNDKILIQTPIYPPFVSVVKHHKRELLENSLIYENGKYSIDFEDFEDKAKDATMFLFCSPHNPTGRVWTKFELDKIIDICIKHNVLIISDEIHSDIVFTKYHSLLDFYKIKNQIVILNAPSKTFNIAGLSTSYAIIPNQKLRKKYKINQDKLAILNPNPFGIEALISAYSNDRVWLNSLIKHILENIEFVIEFLKDNSIPIKVVQPQATFLLWLDCKGLDMPHEEIVDFFVHKAKLGLNDGKSFTDKGDGFMRLNIGIGKDVLSEAMDRLNIAYKGIK